MLAATVRDGERIVDHRLFLLHKSQYEIVDDWQVLGMRATRSMTVTAKDVFVPELQDAVRVRDTRRRRLSRGARESPSGISRSRADPGRPRRRRLRHRQCAGGARSHDRLGEGAQHELHRAKMRDFQTVQLQVGEAGALIDSGAPDDAQRLHRGPGDREPQSRSRQGDQAAIQAQRGVRSAPLQRGRGHPCTPWRARTAFTSHSRWSASSATRTRCRDTSPATSIPMYPRGASPRWAERWATLRFDRSSV